PGPRQSVPAAPASGGRKKRSPDLIAASRRQRRHDRPDEIRSPPSVDPDSVRPGRRAEEARPVSEGEPLIRNVSDTALWAANYRAAETDRPDALFRDPFAKRLAGERGRQIADAVPGAARADWAWVGRTYLF